MEIVLIIIGLVTVVSLYDYFSGKNWQNVTSSNRNELVFQNRNKAYGAYAIRRNYDRNMVFILGGLILLTGILSLGYLYAGTPKTEISREIPDTWDTTIMVLDDDDDPVIPKPDKPVTPPSALPEIEFPTPVFTDDSVDTKPPVQDQFDDVAAGNHTNLNPDGGDDWGTPPPGGGGTGDGNDLIDLDKPLGTADIDVDPEFPGSLADYVIPRLRYPEAEAREGIGGVCKLRFVVNKDGSVSDVEVIYGVPNCPRCDKEAIRVLKSMPNWKPGEKNGRKVRVYILLPINFEPPQ